MSNFVKTVILILLGLSLTILAQIPQTLSYQGVLLDDAGSPLNGNYSIKFKLYDDPIAGNELWEETKSVDIDEGIFNVILGSANPINLTFDQIYYLGITVGASGNELQPRIELTSSAYALNAKSVEDSSITTSKISNAAITAEKIAANQVVKSINSITDNVQLVEGSNITIVPSGNNLTISASSGGSGGNTLDQAYDQGGAGVGRTIVADSGPFEVSGTDGALFGGTYLSGSIPYEGEGVRMMWYPGKAAFRAGGLSSGRSTFWDDDSVGNYSFAFGYNTKAKGSYSTSMGWTTNATGTVASAFGHSTTASGYASTAMGRGIEVSGDYSFGIALSDQSGINVTKDSTLAIMGGNVGIGTTTPQYPISILAENVNRGLYLDHDQTTDGEAYGAYIDFDSDYAGTYFNYGIYSSAVNNGGATQVVSIYGISNGSTIGEKVGVFGAAGGSGVKYGISGIAYSTDTFTKYGVYGNTLGSGMRYGVYASGNLAYTGSLISVSDKNLKNNDQNLSDVLPKLMRLQPKSYNFKTDEYEYMNLSEGLHYGVIAQELEKEFPELVIDAIHPGGHDEDGEKISDSIQYKGIKSIELIPLLLQGMKEQQELINNLQKELNDLKQIVNKK